MVLSSDLECQAISIHGRLSLRFPFLTEERKNTARDNSQTLVMRSEITLTNRKHQEMLDYTCKDSLIRRSFLHNRRGAMQRFKLSSSCGIVGRAGHALAGHAPSNR